MDIHMKVLKGKKPILFAWMDAETRAVEGFLVSCPCQGFNLNRGPREDAHALNMARALERAEVLSLPYGRHVTGMVEESFDEKLEEGQRYIVDGARKRYVKKKSNGDKPCKKHKHRQGKREEDDFTERSKAEFATGSDVTGSEPTGTEDAESERVPSLVEDVASCQVDRPAQEFMSDTPSLPSLSPEDNVGDDLQNSVGDERFSMLESDVSREQEAEYKGGEPSSSHLVDTPGCNSYDPINGSKNTRNPGTRNFDLIKLSKDGTRIDDSFQSSYEAIDDQNVGNTVEVGNSDIEESSLLEASSDHSSVEDQGSTKAVSDLGTAKMVNLDIPSTEPVLLSSAQGTAPVIDEISASGSNAHGMLSDPQPSQLGQSPGWSPDQEQKFMKSIEKFLTNPDGRPLSSDASVSHVVQENHAECKGYDARIIWGEAYGPLNRIDQSRRDRYLAYRAHKDDKFRRKYRQYRAKKSRGFVLCELCAAPLTSKNLKQHMTAVHSIGDHRARRFVCHLCGKTFLAQHNLKRHMDKHNGKRYKCSFCSKTYSQDHTRKFHEREHSGDYRQPLRNPFIKGKGASSDPASYVECELCHKPVKSSYLTTHMKKAHQNGFFTCEICSKVLRESGKRDHMLRHTAEKKFLCSFCSKKFISKGALGAHIRVHTNERPYKCSHCEECFKTSHMRNTHTRIHTGEKPYRCDKCEKSWINRTTYWGHMKKHHPGEPLMYIRKSSQIQAVRDAARAQLENARQPREDALHVFNEPSQRVVVQSNIPI